MNSLKKSPEKEIISVLQLKDGDAGQTVEQNKKINTSVLRARLLCRDICECPV